MTKRILLFDVDWTLISAGGAGIRALNFVFEQIYKIPSAMTRVSPDGKTDPSICREMIRVHLGREPVENEIESLCKNYLGRLAEEIPQSADYKILPGIPSLLKALSIREEVLMGLGTGNLEKGAQIKLERSGLLKYFQFGGYGSDSEERPMVLRTAVQREVALLSHAIDPRDVFVIGDNIRDVQAGKAIGAVTVAVATGPMSYEELAQTKADHLFHDLSDTKNVLETLLT